jgi:hypothetical protein
MAAQAESFAKSLKIIVVMRPSKGCVKFDPRFALGITARSADVMGLPTGTIAAARERAFKNSMTANAIRIVMGADNTRSEESPPHPCSLGACMAYCKTHRPHHNVFPQQRSAHKKQDPAGWYRIPHNADRH